jgi:hypothetical protein
MCVKRTIEQTQRIVKAAGIQKDIERGTCYRFGYDTRCDHGLRDTGCKLRAAPHRTLEEAQAVFGGSGERRGFTVYFNGGAVFRCVYFGQQARE